MDCSARALYTTLVTFIPISTIRNHMKSKMQILHHPLINSRAGMVLALLKKLQMG